MSDDDQIGTLLADAIEGLVQYGRLAERIMAAMANTTSLVTTLGSIADLDIGLAPEVRAALEHTQEVAEALDRAGKFIEARYEAQKGQLGGA